MADSNWSEWKSLGRSNLNQMGVGFNADGRLEIFGLTGDGTLLHDYQLSPGGAWSGWQKLGDPQTISASLAVAENLDGRIEVFGIGTDGTVKHIYQTAPNNGWSGWGSLGAPPDISFQNVVVGRNQDGRLEVVAQAGDGSMWHKWQNKPNSDWSGWHNLNNPSGNINFLAIERDLEGFLQVFAVASDNTVWNVSQTRNKWEWKSLGTPSTTFPIIGISAGGNDDGRLELFVIPSDDNLWHDYQRIDARQQVSWSGWSELGKPTNESVVSVGQTAVILNQDDALQVFVIDDEGSMWTLTQKSGTRTGWGDWDPLGAPTGALIVNPAVARNHDGRLELFALTNTGEVAHIQEVEQTRLQWFKNLVASVAPIVYLHPDETFMPSSFEWYLRKTHYVDANGHDQGPLTPALVEQAPHGENGYLTYPWNDESIRKGDLGSAVCYAHVIASADQAGYDIQYWFFSPFNGAGIIGLSIRTAGHEWPGTFSIPPVGEHEGDWEEIVVRVDRSGKIQKVFCSQHSGGEWYNQASKPGAHDGYTLQNGHPVIYSALNGHPSFPWIGDFPTKDPSGTKIGFSVGEGAISASGGLLNQTGQGARWDCFLPDHHKLLAIDTPDFTYSSNTWWLPFRGRVGALKPSIGDTEQEAAERLAQNIGTLVGLGIIHALLVPLALLIVQALIVAAPYLDNPRGPTSIITKDDWSKSPS